MEEISLKIKCYGKNVIDEGLLEFAVICTKYNEKWVYVKHKERDTWEIPGGHREKDEEIIKTGIRELIEETGADSFSIMPLFDYSVERNQLKRYGKVFYSEIVKIGEIPESEIEKIELFDKMPVNLTYPEIQPKLFEEVIKRIEEADKYKNKNNIRNVDRRVINEA